MQFKKEIIFKSIWYWLTIVLGVSIVFLVDALLYAKNIDSALINSKQFFGLYGNNLVAILITIFLATLYAIFGFKNKLFFPMWIVLVGAISNLVGRLYLGGVADYINVSFIPTFNIADVLIVFGLFLSIYFNIKKELKLFKLRLVS